MTVTLRPCLPLRCYVEMGIRCRVKLMRVNLIMVSVTDAFSTVRGNQQVVIFVSVWKGLNQSPHATPPRSAPRMLLCCCSHDALRNTDHNTTTGARNTDLRPERTHQALPVCVVKTTRSPVLRYDTLTAPAGAGYLGEAKGEAERARVLALCVCS